jgi:hypothetical protein
VFTELPDDDDDDTGTVDAATFVEAPRVGASSPNDDDDTGTVDAATFVEAPRVGASSPNDDDDTGTVDAATFVEAPRVGASSPNDDDDTGTVDAPLFTNPDAPRVEVADVTTGGGVTTCWGEKGGKAEATPPPGTVRALDGGR